MKYIVSADANVILDGLLQRGDMGLDALEIIELAEYNKIELFVSSSNLLNVIYFLKKANKNNSQIIVLIKKILSFTTVNSPDNLVLINALDTGFNDIEDAIQYFTALQIKGINYFITSNSRDFKKATHKLPVLTPSQFLKQYKNSKPK
ncbi:MAG: hypothetical protein JWQ09_5550 [Segetibacter sp.]|nr:hypothetical protein [Segetibacter sp.]